MTILGIDPGTATTGYGVVRVLQTKKQKKCLAYGIVATSPKDATGKRLKTLETGLLKLIKTHKPNIVVLEKLFFFKNLKTALPVSQALGVILLTCYKKKIDVCQYTPLQIKMTLTGYGRAEKKDVQKKVKNVLRLKEIPKPDDAADGLAIALCFCKKMGK